MNTELQSFVDEIFKYKKLTFAVDEIVVDEQLFEQNVLKLADNIISINNYEAIIPVFINLYQDKFRFIFSEDFIGTAKFLHSLTKDFASTGYIYDFHLLENEMWKFFIKKSNLEFQSNFFDYISLNESKTIFKFIQAYSEILLDLNLSSEEILQNTISLIQSVKTEGENVYNMPLYSILTGLKNKCHADERVGLDLFNKALMLDESNGNIVTAIVTGLYEKKGEEFYETVLNQIVSSEKHLSAVLFGLSNVQKVSDSDCTIFLGLIEKFSGQKTVQIPILSLVFSILKSENQKHHDLCFKKLLMSVEDKDFAIFTLKNINSITNYIDYKKHIILRIINQPFFTLEEYISSINHFFIYNKDVETFKSVVLEIIKVKPFEKFISKFQSFYQSINRTDFDQFLVELLIDNSASKRFTGLEVINSGSIHAPYRFSFDILSLPPISQYKLWVSLTLDYHHPKDRFMSLLPLLNSKSEFVRESFICKLEEASEDYGGQISELLKSNLDNIKYSAIIQRIECYISDFYAKNTAMKNSIKEFDPYNTHYSLIRKFNDVFQKKMSKSINSGVRENSILSILGTNTVQLAKGGGWRSSGNKNISQLGSFGSSFMMPRTYFINPNKYELEIGYQINRDWTEEEFAEIKTILDNEQ